MFLRTGLRSHEIRLIVCLLLGVWSGCVLLWPGPAEATTYSWHNNTGNDEFADGDNWQPVGGPPIFSDVARFGGQLQGSGVGDNGLHVPGGRWLGSMEVTNSLGYPATVVDMTIGDGTTGSRFDLMASNDRLLVGTAAGDTATLNLLGGSFYTNNAQVGGRATFDISGAGSYWDAEDVIVWGDIAADTAVVKVGDRANVRSDMLIVGADAAGGRVEVDGYTPGVGTRPLWTVEGPVYVGSLFGTDNDGFGILTLRRTGQMTANTLVQVRGTNTQSTITVESGGNLSVPSGKLQVVGYNGLLELVDAASVISVGTIEVESGGIDWTGGTLEVTDSPVLLGASGGADSLGTAGLVLGSGMMLKATASPQSLVVGRDLQAGLAVYGGGVVECHSGYIGESAGSKGFATISGANTELRVTDELRLGFVANAQGELTIVGGGLVTAGIVHLALRGLTSGTIIVDSAGQTPTSKSTLISQSALAVGGTVYDSIPGASGGTGKLTVKNGGLVNVDSILKVWSGGRVELLAGSQTPSEIHTGTFRNQEGGTFVHDDGVLTVHGGEFAPNAGGSYSIDSPGGIDLPKVVLDEGANYSSTATLHVGEHYSGLLEIRNGSTVSTFNGRIGTDTGTSFGNVIVDGHDGGNPSMWMNSEDLEVGVRNYGSLTISGGGLVADKHGEIAAVPGSVGSVTVDDGGTWRNSIGLVVGGNSFGAGGQGTLNTRAGGRVEADDHVRVYPNGLVSMLGGEIHAGPGGFFIEGGELQGTGGIVLSGGGGLDNDGRVSPGIAVPGPLTIAGGDYVQYSGTALNVDIAGTDPADYSRLEITSGVAYLNGTMHVNLISGPYTPAAGDRFEILTAAGGLSGTEFDSLVAPNRPGLAWDLVYEPTVVALEVFLDADFDHDRTVSGTDFLIWQRGYGSGNPAHIDGDANGDGNVDAADLARWKQTFGDRVSSMPLTAAVPEPASGALWGMSAWAILVYCLRDGYKTLAFRRNL